MTLHERDAVQGWLDRMSEALRSLADRETDSELLMIGIRRGGAEVAKLLHHSLSLSEPLGELNIAFYRDDFSSIGLHPVVGPSEVPVAVEQRHVVLVDDVLASGRTVRAAMNEIFDYGRPARITLAVLVQRDDHELPIRADVVGHSLSVSPGEHVQFDADALSVRISKQTGACS